MSFNSSLSTVFPDPNCTAEFTIEIDNKSYEIDRIINRRKGRLSGIVELQVSLSRSAINS